MKKTQIMAGFIVLLAAMLCIGAVSAAVPQDQMNNLSVNMTSVTLAQGVATSTISFNLTNETTGGIGQLPQLANIFYSWNTTTAQAIPTATVNNSTITLNGGLFSITGTYTLKFYDAANIVSATNVSKATVTINIVDADAITTDKSDVFVYEYIFINGATNLQKMSDGASPSVINQISGINGVFYLTESAVNGQYGTYNVTNGGNVKQINIWYPEITLGAELSPATGDSINGKTINKQTSVTFLINSPKVAPAFTARGQPATAKVVFTTPAGGKTTVFGTNPANSLASVTLNGVQTKSSGMVIGDNAEAGTWTAWAEYLTAPFDDYAEKSNTISFTVQSTSLTLTAAKDSVVRSNPFTVTIQGNSKALYFVYLDGASSDDQNPTLQPGQSGMKSLVTDTNVPSGKATVTSADKTALAGTYAYFETDASGKRTVQYNTLAQTEDKTYTVKVYGIKEAWTSSSATYNTTDDYDTVKVKVEKGAVTVAAAGDGSYYIGDEIKITGTNTDSSNIWLFITGPNLLTNGEVVKELPSHTAAATVRNADVSVKTDNTWEYKWDTSKVGLDTGAYTIYATSRLTNGKSSETISNAVKLSDSEYATVSVNLKQPFLSAVPSGTIVAKGDKIYIRGTAEGDPSMLKLYIFGPNKYHTESITVEDDGSYEKKLEIGSEWSSNQYYVVIEHPMYNNEIDVNQFYYTSSGTKVDNTSSTGYDHTTLEIRNFGNTTTAGLQASFIVEGTGKLQGSNAADALTKMIDSANIDDIYTKLTFTVAEPWIKIVNPGDQAMGSKFTITGTTNLAVDDQILVEIMSSSFTAIDKTATDITSGISQTTKVVAGEGADNTWSVEVDTTNWKLDEYTIKVQGIEVDVTSTTNFNLVEKVVTTVPTTSATTAVPTGATSVPTTTPTKTPGFGAFIALAGLGAVALLVLRRN